MDGAAQTWLVRKARGLENAHTYVRPGADIITGIESVDYFIGEYALARYTFALRTAREHGVRVEEVDANDDAQAETNDEDFASS